MHDLSDDTFKMNDKVAMLVKLSFSCNASAKLVTMQQNEETGKLEDIGASGNKTEIITQICKKLWYRRCSN
jgi:hypothetical protein